MSQLTYPGRVSFAHAAQRDIHKRFSDDRATFKTTPFFDVPISPPGQSSSLLDSISLDTAGGGMSTLHPFVCPTIPFAPSPPFFLTYPMPSIDDYSSCRSNIPAGVMKAYHRME